MTYPKLLIKNCNQIGTKEGLMQKKEKRFSAAEKNKALDIQNADSAVLQQFYLNSPYMIFLETCLEDSRLYNTYQITPAGCECSEYNENQRRELAARPQHRHSFIEIMFVLNGSVTNRIENQTFTYTAGQCCIMNSNIRHCEVFEGNYQAVFFMFQNTFLKSISDTYFREQQLTSAVSEKSPVFRLIDDAVSSAHQFDKAYLDVLPVVSAEKILKKITPLFNSIIFETTEKEAGYYLCVQGIFTRIISLFENTALYSVCPICSEADRSEYLATKIIHLLETSHGHFSRSQLTKRLHYSGEYLNRVFRNHTGKTITEYRQQICLKEAEHLLVSTDLPISSIISEIGFSNRSYFYRLFEDNYGLTPLEYRRLQKTDTQ